MARATRDDVLELLREAGASPVEALEVVEHLADAGLNPPQMRTWLHSPERCYSIAIGVGAGIAPGVEWRQVPTRAIELDRTDAVIEAARAFAEATEAERFISRTLLCELERVRRLTQDDPDRTAMLVDLARQLKNALGKDVHVHDVICRGCSTIGSLMHSKRSPAAASTRSR